MEKHITVITYKEVEQLTTWRGDENRLVHLSRDNRITMQSIDNFKKDKVKGQVVLDVTGLTILQYFKICRKLGFFIKNVHFRILLKSGTERCLSSFSQRILVSVKYLIMFTNGFITFSTKYFFHSL